MKIIVVKTHRTLNYIAVFTVLIILLVLTYNTVFSPLRNHKASLFMGANLIKEIQPSDVEVSNINTDIVNAETYFRPSKLPALNNRLFNKWDNNNGQTEKISLPMELHITPQDTIINYFSILREAENLTEKQMAGCGTLGSGKIPFPGAYEFFTTEYKAKVPFDRYLKSFEGIGHTTLIKLYLLPEGAEHPGEIRYFVEIETIEGSLKQVTNFVYYYGFIYLIQQKDSGNNNVYYIENIDLHGEDFLCAPYHGWAHDAEASVSIRYGNWCKMIKEQFPTKQDGYVKRIYFKGNDSKDYLIKFIQLTNDTDIEVAQYIKNNDGKWKPIHLDPNKCLDNKVKP